MSTGNKHENFFDKVAESWDDDPHRVGLARSVTEKIIENVPLNDKMISMEFGCGTGLISINLAPKVKKVIAVDSSENMLETLKRKMEQFNCRNIVTHRLDPDALELPFEEKIDFIFSSMVFHHIKETDGLLRMLYGTMNLKGYLAVDYLDKEDGSFHGGILVDVQHFGFKRKDLAEKMKSAGFTPISDLTAHVFTKPNKEGIQTEYPIFLMIARKD